MSVIARKINDGFTIVELLIVIVVIGILASISIVSYNGVTTRAEATKTISAVGAYRDALQLYKLDNGTYPATGAFCLGDQYPTYGGGTVPACRNSTSQIPAAANAAARDGLKAYLGGSLPMPSSKTIIPNGATEYVGAHFYGSAYNYTLDGKPIVTIEYYVTVSTCPVGPVYAATAPNFTSPAVERSQTFGTNASRCFLLLPQ